MYNYPSRQIFPTFYNSLHASNVYHNPCSRSRVLGVHRSGDCKALQLATLSEPRRRSVLGNLDSSSTHPGLLSHVLQHLDNKRDGNQPLRRSVLLEQPLPPI
ncbi:hypothetical protein AcW1_007798 [Taiwanofungus camphoratus]|nr:hypothetical protein AcW2_007145 [Antrodia cinnamomea]KAI0926790.1 hypothetical protein AcV5_007484 [Antrodia cinnamomea]KAI0953624.1 hypothetical protein AcW1_007798 [Antrodia cinnamomea]